MIPDVTKARWEKWRTKLHVLEHLSIPRRFKPSNFGVVVRKELHHFPDASTEGYGQSSNIRLQDDSGKTHCSSVVSKLQVTPLKPVRVQCLELQAAVTAVKVSQQIHKDLSLDNI